ncbi:unextended protein isoform X2 [Chrysoperla carnea]|uniref:unextended protein isoform X2 n=1 Tax=Chrysoperla carnea TaxID=189513 RepID=UPI001D07FE22|nr:unextended protein isoform X2 [Chrysoperla carnea]
MAKGVFRMVNYYCVWIFWQSFTTILTSEIQNRNQLLLSENLPSINSLNVLNHTIVSDNQNTIHNRYVLELHGTNLHENIDIWPIIREAKRGELCETNENFNNFHQLSFLNHSYVQYDLDVKLSEANDFDISLIYFCVSQKSVSVHQGENISVVFRTNLSSSSVHHDENNDRPIHPARRKLRSVNDLYTPTLKNIPPPSIHDDSSENVDENRHDIFPRLVGPQHLDDDIITESEPVQLTGFRVEKSEKGLEFDEGGIPTILIHMPTTIRVYGIRITENTLFTFTKEDHPYGKTCLMPVTEAFQVEAGSLKSTGDHDPKVVNGIVHIQIPVPSEGKNLYICTKEKAPKNTPPEKKWEYENRPFIHQGSTEWLAIRSHEKLLPLWASIVIILVCLSFSALFSGLNLGLMSLDRTELKILLNTGTQKERKYAKKIQPVRDQGNFLLCSILLGNVFVNSIFTILLDDLTSGLIAVVSSTITIVLFGEITPQAICSRHGLAIGAKTIIMTKIVMGFTAPLSYPISKALDFMLGEEIGNVYNRERLKELVKVTTDTNDLDKDEVNIISGALELRKKTVSDVMTRIEDVFMLDYESILNFETVSEIMKSGFSRIPVFEGTRTNIVTMLYIKDLAFVDPDDNTPLKTLCQFYQNPCNFVYEDVTLDVMFKQFKEGHKGHMAFVHRVNNEGEGDPFYETVGLVTLEDVIEELIQAEIMDETDVFTDNRSKRRRNEHRKQDFTIFAERREHQRIRISPQLTLATFQYLSTSIDLFRPDNISETILRRMLKQDIIVHIKKKDKHDPLTIIYQQGKPADYFVLVLEGRVEVTVGRESLLFESGPFTYFGKQALMQNVGGVAESPTVQPTNMGSLQSVNMETLLRHTFVPDYSVRAVTEVLYIKIKRSLYMAALRATLMERSQKGDITGGEQFDEEVEKFFKLIYTNELVDGRRTSTSTIKRERRESTSSINRERKTSTPTVREDPNAEEIS